MNSSITMILKTTIVSFILFISSLSGFSQAKHQVNKDYINAESLMQTTGFLSSDRFMGRLAGSPEYEMAARHVALRFKELGLKPVGQESFLQFFEVEYNTIDKAKVTINYPNNSEPYELRLGTDFVCRGLTGSGDFEAEMAFVGFGIQTDHYNDYKDIDVSGKVVIAFRQSPLWNLEGGNWGDISPRGKARVAKENGAKAIVFINVPNEIPSRELIGSTACGAPPHLYDFPMLQITKEIANSIFISSNASVDGLYNAIYTNRIPNSFSLNSKIWIRIEANYDPKALTPNVVGVWEGNHKTKKNEYIVVGAHLDHVGTQERMLIFPGANDNASGVASLIEMAMALKQGNINTDRSILFVIFSAEESGMHGSNYFVENPTVDLNQIVAMLNFDCVAQGDSIAIGGKHSFPKLWSIAESIDKKTTRMLSSQTFGGGGADAEAFYRKGIPTLYFNTSGGYKHLHLPTDTAETLNAELFETLTRLGFETLIHLAKGGYIGEKDQLKKYNRIINSKR